MYETTMDRNLFIFIGYIVFTLYTVFIMLSGIFLEKHTRINKTVCRKLTHIFSAFIWVICYIFFGYSLHWLILNGISTVALGFVIFNKNFKAFGRDDAKNSVGLFYFGLSTFAVATVCYLIGPELYLYTGIAYYCLTLGDGFAPLTAMLAGERNRSLLPGKTVVGSLTVYVVSFLSTLVFSLIFDMRLSVLFMLSVAALTCIAEFYGVKGLDNVFIEFSVFGYILLYHYGLVSVPLQIVLAVSPVLAWIAVGSKSMSAGAGISAFLLFALTGFFGNAYLPILFLAFLFSVSVAVSVVRKRLLRNAENKFGGGGPRRSKQIVAVGLFALIALAIYYYSGIRLFYYLFFLALAEQFADSMASDIGSFTKKRNINIVTFKPIEKGLSGGVSLLGTLCALASGFIILAIPLIAGAISPTVYVCLSLIAFLGTLIDSLAGALLQALYRCSDCGKLTEIKNHCGKRAKLIKGFDLIDNTAVNYIAGFFTCVLGGLLYFI